MFDLLTKTTTVIAQNGRVSPGGRGFRPDGKLVRFTVSDAQSQLTSLWEVRPDGKELRQLCSLKGPLVSLPVAEKLDFGWKIFSVPGGTASSDKSMDLG